MKRITAHVALGHPNGQRIRAGLQFIVTPQEYNVTDEQLRAIKADPAIIVTRVAKAEAAAKADKPKPEENAADGQSADAKAEAAAKADKPKPTRRAQAQTAVEQEAADESK